MKPIHVDLESCHTRSLGTAIGKMPNYLTLPAAPPKWRHSEKQTSSNSEMLFPELRSAFFDLAALDGC